MKKLITLITISIIITSCSTPRNVGCTPIAQKAKKEQTNRLNMQFGYR